MSHPSIQPHTLQFIHPPTNSSHPSICASSTHPASSIHPSIPPSIPPHLHWFTMTPRGLIAGGRIVSGDPPRLWWGLHEESVDPGVDCGRSHRQTPLASQIPDTSGSWSSRWQWKADRGKKQVIIILFHHHLHHWHHNCNYNYHHPHCDYG